MKINFRDEILLVNVFRKCTDEKFILFSVCKKYGKDDYNSP